MSSSPNSGADLSAILTMLEKLHLFHTAKGAGEFLNRAAQENLSHQDFLLRLLEGELASRHERTVARLIREARFPCIKTIDTFDWAHPTRIPKALILNALKLDFVERKEHLIFRIIRL